MGGCCSRTESVDEVKRKRPIRDVGGHPGYRAVNNNRNKNNVHKVDLNLANIPELSTLPDITLYRAQAIVNYRSQHGPFQKINDILNVPGISGKILNKIENRIYLSHNSSYQLKNKNPHSEINGTTIIIIVE